MLLAHKKDGFAIRDAAKFDIKNKALRIEKLKTRIDMRQPIRFDGKLKQVTISKRAGKYFASIIATISDHEISSNTMKLKEKKC